MKPSWNDLLRNQFCDWLDADIAEAVDGIKPMAPETVLRAMRVACFLRDHNERSPDRVVPTGDGGIAFQYDGYPFTSIEVPINGPVEKFVFRSGGCVERIAVTEL